MKFLSVCVFYIYVRVAYSYTTGTPTTSFKPIDTPTGYSTINSQNTYDTSKQNIDLQNGKYNPSQPLPIPVNYKMGPGSSIPFQSPETTSGFQQTRTFNPQAYNAGSRSQASTIQHLIRNPYIKNMYTKNLPPKRYTIIHPNGQIEHTDEIKSVTSKYSQYVMLKAADIVANVGQSNKYKNPPGQPQYIQPDFSNTNQNQWTTINPPNRLYNQLVPSNQKYEYQRNINTNAVSNAANVNTAEVTRAIQEDPNKVSTNINTTETITKEGAEDNVVAGNPLPIYPENPSPNDIVENEKPTKTVVTSEQKYLNPSNSNVTTNNETILSKPTVTLKLPDGIDLHESYLPGILPEVIPPSVPEKQIPPIDDDLLKNETATTPSNTEKTDALNNDLKILNSTTEQEKPIDILKTPINETNTVESVEKIPTVQNTTSPNPDVANQSKTPDKQPMVWFELSEDKIWEAIRNNNSNVYFLFLPPRPRVTKEIRTTIYPNGTSYKEVIETVADYGEDGEQPVKNKATVSS